MQIHDGKIINSHKHPMYQTLTLEYPIPSFQVVSELGMGKFVIFFKNTKSGLKIPNKGFDLCP